MKNSKLAGKYNLSGIFWWSLLAAGLLALLLYGLSIFLAKPTVETITTPAPRFDANSPAMQNVKAHSSRRKH